MYIKYEYTKIKIAIIPNLIRYLDYTSIAMLHNKLKYI